MNNLNKFIKALFDRQLMPTAIKIAMVVGTILFAINHGSTLIKGKMTKERWMSAIITYIVPYAVNIHGQCFGQSSQQKDKMT